MREQSLENKKLSASNLEHVAGGAGDEGGKVNGGPREEGGRIICPCGGTLVYRTWAGGNNYYFCSNCPKDWIKFSDGSWYWE